MQARQHSSTVARPLDFRRTPQGLDQAARTPLKSSATAEDSGALRGLVQPVTCGITRLAKKTFKWAAGADRGGRGECGRGQPRIPAPHRSRPDVPSRTGQANARVTTPAHPWHNE